MNKVAKTYFGIHGYFQRSFVFEGRALIAVRSKFTSPDFKNWHKVTFMNYYLASAALKLVSMSPLTMSAYRSLAKNKASVKLPNKEIGEWLLERVPSGPLTVLDLGTGWISAYSIAVALSRPECEIHSFDVQDIRYGIGHFKEAVRQSQELYFPEGDLPGAGREKLEKVYRASSLDEAYKELGLHYQVAESGLPDYPDSFFDIVFSIDVLEHIPARQFEGAAKKWASILKPGGQFLAQVGLVDHTSYWCYKKDDKRYIKHSELVWKLLLENKVQYINRLTATEIMDLLEGAGIETLEHDRLCASQDMEVHPDYADQARNDATCLRLYYQGVKK